MSGAPELQHGTKQEQTEGEALPSGLPRHSKTVVDYVSPLEEPAQRKCITDTVNNKTPDLNNIHLILWHKFFSTTTRLQIPVDHIFSLYPNLFYLSDKCPFQFLVVCVKTVTLFSGVGASVQPRKSTVPILSVCSLSSTLVLGIVIMLLN